MAKLTIWTNHGLSEEQLSWVKQACEGHQLVLEPGAKSSERLREAHIAFGQPPLADVLASSTLRWVQVSSAGYGTYAEAGPRLARQGLRFTKSSAVYAQPCAEQVVSFLFAQSRCLPRAFKEQCTDRGWPQGEIRSSCRLLGAQSALLIGFGSIGTRLVELLAPLRMKLTGARRSPSSSDPIAMVSYEGEPLRSALAEADHVINLLPGVEQTAAFFGRERFEAMKPGAVYYSVGRGTTTDHEALLDQLRNGRLAAAWLDVTDPEPLPKDHPLWREPNCYITPHAAGGHHNEGDRLVQHFVQNLQRYLLREPLEDEVLFQS